jgi:CRISP-associated protein Cas1
MSTIYITEQNVSFKVHNPYLKVFHSEVQRICMRVSNISQFILFTNVNLPNDVLKLVRSHEIPVLYLTPDGSYIGRLENPSQAQAQYLIYQKKGLRDAEYLRATTESIIWAKLHNQQACLQSWTRHYADYATQRALNYLPLLMDNLPIAASLNELREYSEEADNVYYRAIASLLSMYSGCPKINVKRVNRLFELGSHLLHQYIYTLLKTAGVHPDYSILHSQRNYELPLAWDFTSEFRALMVDDLVLNFARNLTHANGNGKKQPQTLLQSFLQHWEAKLRTFVLHPYAGEVTYRQCLNLQVQEYVASLLGDVEFYRPLVLKFHPKHSDFKNITLTQQSSLTLVK